jgi:hypothetical protein
LWLIKHWFSASTFVVKIATFAKPETDVKNRPSGQFFTSSPRYAGNVKPSLLSHDVLTSPALLDFPSRASSLGKPRKAGARCMQFIEPLYGGKLKVINLIYSSNFNH